MRLRLTTRALTLMSATAFTLMGFSVVYLVIGLLAGWGWFAVITAAFGFWLGAYGLASSSEELRLRDERRWRLNDLMER